MTGMDAAARAQGGETAQDLAATVEARKELGPEYEDALIESFLERVERRMRRREGEERVVAARAPGAAPAPAAARPAGDGWGERYGFGMVSLVLAVPLSAIGAGTAGLPGLLVAWLGIVGVNAVQVTGGFGPVRRRAPRD
ncbi:hypothetical protein [Streptomyces chilikensis]|uniref:Integral membrane protein n=1 Tax=Streptomyces chilikensis TaxID=1194079 RepID=A0ABV3EYC5_9ACTN